MHNFGKHCAIALTALAGLGALSMAAVPASAATQAAQTQSTDSVDRGLTAARAIYDEAGQPGMENDHRARLTIYRRALAALNQSVGTGPHADVRVENARLFYRSTIAVHMLASPEQAAGLREVDALVPQFRQALTRSPADYDLQVGFAQLLRVQVRTAITENNTARALEPARALAALTRQLSTSNPSDTFVRRAFAIDLDQLSSLEESVGNIAAADAANGEALQLFRQLAAAEPQSRPAQGSLLIGLIRRAAMFGYPELIPEAERQIAAMRGRGQLVDQYARIASSMGEVRALAEQAQQQRRQRR
jgi:hypothetical protein